MLHFGQDEVKSPEVSDIQRHMIVNDCKDSWYLRQKVKMLAAKTNLQYTSRDHKHLKN